MKYRSKKGRFITFEKKKIMENRLYGDLNIKKKSFKILDECMVNHPV